VVFRKRVAQIIELSPNLRPDGTHQIARPTASEVSIDSLESSFQVIGAPLHNRIVWSAWLLKEVDEALFDGGFPKLQLVFQAAP
jgi:hypothetical protein